MTGSTAGPERQPAESGHQAILRAARRAFAKRPYAEVTMRGIAADAGVSPALIVKRFGGKELLFNTIADFGPAADALFDAPPERLGHHLIVTLVSMRREQQMDPLIRAIFSLGDEDERSLLRVRFREQITGRLAELLPGDEPQLRAELIAGQLLGMGATLALHQPGGATAVAGIDRLAELYAPGVQALIDWR